MAEPVFLFTDDKTLVQMNETLYEREDELQHILAKYPKLLFPGDDGDVPLLLVQREAGIPGDECEGDSFSLDHLFLDHDGIPTLVEVKRGTDTRIRREVIGQMLDYAANAVAYWSVDKIRGMFDATWEHEGKNPDDVLLDYLGEDGEPDAYWSTVKTNLQAGKIRMIFAADTIPNRLLRIVEFLNEQMDPAEVIAVEIRQFVSEEGIRMIAPRILGQSAKTEQRKGVQPKRKWDELAFMEELEQQSPVDVPVASKLLQWAKANGLRIWWGEGRTVGSFFPILDLDGSSHIIFSVWTSGKIEVQFQWMKKRSQFEDQKMRLEFLERLNSIEDVHIPEDAIGRRPTFPIAALRDAKDYEAFIGAVQWAIQVYEGNN